MLALVLLLAGCTWPPPGPARTGTVDHVVIIVMENKAASRILGAKYGAPFTYAELEFDEVVLDPPAIPTPK